MSTATNFAVLALVFITVTTCTTATTIAVKMEAIEGDIRRASAEIEEANRRLRQMTEELRK